MLFKAGKNRDGYFKNEDIIEQAEDAMDILDETHPNQRHMARAEQGAVQGFPVLHFLPNEYPGFSSNALAVGYQLDMICTQANQTSDVDIPPHANHHGARA